MIRSILKFIGRVRANIPDQHQGADGVQPSDPIIAEILGGGPARDANGHFIARSK